MVCIWMGNQERLNDLKERLNNLREDYNRDLKRELDILKDSQVHEINKHNNITSQLRKDIKDELIAKEGKLGWIDQIAEGLCPCNSGKAYKNCHGLRLLK